MRYIWLRHCTVGRKQITEQKSNATELENLRQNENIKGSVFSPIDLVLFPSNPLLSCCMLILRAKNSHKKLIGTSHWKLFPQFVTMVVYEPPEGRIGLRLKSVQEHM